MNYNSIQINGLVLSKVTKGRKTIRFYFRNFPDEKSEKKFCQRSFTTPKFQFCTFKNLYFE